MKNCIYFVKHNESGKWYVGSHKNSDNIASKAYMGGGVDIRAAVELYGSDAFHSESLIEFADRNEAYKAEHQLLNHIDAAGNKMSYNRTNNSWPKEGFWSRRFGSKKGPLTSGQLESFKKQIMGEPGTVDRPVTGDITVERLNHWKYTHSTNLQSLITNIPAISEIGEKAAYIDFSKRNFDIQLGHLIAKLEQAIEDEIFAKENELAHLEVVGDTDMTDHKVLVVQLTNEINKIKKEKEKVDNENGYYKSIYRALSEGFTRGKDRKTKEMLSEHSWKRAK